MGIIKIQAYCDSFGWRTLSTHSIFRHNSCSLHKWPETEVLGPTSKVTHALLLWNRLGTKSLKDSTDSEGYLWILVHTFLVSVRSIANHYIRTENCYWSRCVSGSVSRPLILESLLSTYYNPFPNSPPPEARTYALSGRQRSQTGYILGIE